MDGLPLPASGQSAAWGYRGLEAIVITLVATRDGHYLLGSGKQSSNDNAYI